MKLFLNKPILLYNIFYTLKCIFNTKNKNIFASSLVILVLKGNTKNIIYKEYRL